VTPSLGPTALIDAVLFPSRLSLRSNQERNQKPPWPASSPLLSMGAPSKPTAPTPYYPPKRNALVVVIPLCRCTWSTQEVVSSLPDVALLPFVVAGKEPPLLILSCGTLLLHIFSHCRPVEGSPAVPAEPWAGRSTPSSSSTPPISRRRRVRLQPHQPPKVRPLTLKISVMYYLSEINSL
jgi:hypothetical protein